LKIRIKFSKEGFMQFIGHLDMMRGWQKIFRRSGIPIAYSEGFNPHQIFSIAAPLAVGITSSGEYLDLKLKVENYDLDMLIKQVNAVCPEGIVILEAVELIGKQTAGMAACKAATYMIDLSEKLAKLVLNSEKLESFINQDSIIVKKKNKKGKINDFDIRPGILEFIIVNNALHVMLATGSSLNIKPELLMGAIFNYIGIELNVFTRELYYDIHRIDIYTSLDPLLTLTKGVVNG